MLGANDIVGAGVIHADDFLLGERGVGSDAKDQNGSEHR